VILRNDNDASFANSLSYSFTTPVSTATGFTISCWIKFLKLPVGSGVGFNGRMALFTGYPFYFYILNGNYGIYGFYSSYILPGGGNCQTYQTDLTSPSTGVWYHVTYTFGQGASSVYFNGTLKRTETYVGDSTMGGINIANNGIPSDQSGSFELDDLRIFDRALTSAQVQAVYNQQGVPGRGVQVTSLTYNAPLTGVANMNRIYGIQLLNLNYTGNIINIRRSSDNSNVNFTVDSTNTTLVTASGGQTLASWLGAGTANVVIWYDQSGNGRNLTQVTSTLQPGFSETTGVQFRNLLYMAFPDNCSLSDATICTGFVQNQYLLGNPSSQWYNQDAIISCERGGGTDDWGLVLPGSGLFGFGSGPSDPQVSISTNGLGSYSFMSMTRTNTSGGVTLYKGNGPGTSFTMPSGTKSGTNPSYMGYNQPGNKQYMNSDISSFIWLDSVQPTSFVSLLSSRFLNSKFVPNRSSMTGTPLFNQLSQAAKSSAVGAFSLRAVNGVTAKAVQVRAPQGQFPPAAMTADTTSLTGYSFGGSGSYVASASLDDFFIAYGFNAFDNNLNTYWHSNYPIYTATTGIYMTGDARASLTASIYAGEWLQIKTPTPILLLSYSLVGRSNFELSRSPRKFWILGSNNDGESWSLVDTQSSITWTGPQVAKTFTISNPGTTYFNTFRIVVNEVGNLPTGGVAQDSVQIATWNLVGSPPSQDFYADRLGNLLTAPVTGQSLAKWLGGATGYVTKWYDQSGKGNDASQNTAAAQPIIQKATKGAGYSCLFNGTSTIMTVNAAANLGSTNYTICAASRRRAAGEMYYVGTNGPQSTRRQLSTGYSSDTVTILNQYANALVGATIPGYSSGAEPMGYDFYNFSQTSGMYIYNWRSGASYVASNSARTLPMTSPGNIVLGYVAVTGSTPYFSGEIYEVLVFTQSLYDLNGTSTITQIYQNQLSAYGT
jgi:hypothetical protein